MKKLVILCLLSNMALAQTYDKYDKFGLENEVLGNPKELYTVSTHRKTIISVASDHQVGQKEIRNYNLDIDTWNIKPNDKIVIPTSHILPSAPKTGIVINIPEYRLYYYDNPNKVLSFPISVGRKDWETPITKTKIIQKIKNPTWTPPKSIREEHEKRGLPPLPDVFPAGPNNPLGLFAMRLGVPGYLIHSTNKKNSIGFRTSHGCIRMYPQNIKTLFPLVKNYTPVNIVNEPVKVGYYDGDMYAVVFEPLYGESLDDLFIMLLKKIKEVNGEIPLDINKTNLKILVLEKAGVITKIY